MIQFDHDVTYLPKIDTPRYIVFSDYDETYLSHRMSPSCKGDLERLEEYLLVNCEGKDLMFGWVTGSSLPDVKQKMKEYGLKVVPHFIAHGLGTELHDFDEKSRGSLNGGWKDALDRSRFSLVNTRLLAEELSSHGVDLFLQPEKNQSQYKTSYYYRQVNDERDHENIELMKRKGAELGIKVFASTCNPIARDPEGCCDIDMVPMETGKRNVVRYFLKNSSATKSSCFAFGDSENDLEMLGEVENGYLVANATKEAKNTFSRVAKKKYAGGVLEVLEKFI